MTQPETVLESVAEQHNPWKARALAISVSAAGAALGWGGVKIYEIVNNHNEHVMTEVLGALGGSLLTTIATAIVAVEQLLKDK